MVGKFESLKMYKVILPLFISFSVFYYGCNIEPGISPDNTSGTSNLKDTVMTNVNYGNHVRHKYDIYLPAGRDKNTPVIVMIHGGAWKAGQKEDFNYYVQLIKNNWKNVAIVNINYRLASLKDKIHHEAMMEDIKSAISDVISKSSNYNISTTRFGMIGASAGGQLAMIYAYNHNDHKNIKCVGNIFGPSLIRDWDWYNSTNLWVGAKMGDVLTEYVGKSWDTTAYAKVSPMLTVKTSSQPTIIFHGSLDPVVPVYQSQWMHGKLNTLKVANEYHEYLAFHSFDNNQSDEVIKKIVTFFKKYLQ